MYPRRKRQALAFVPMERFGNDMRHGYLQQSSKRSFLRKDLSPTSS
jgi:hypothetical protein